MVGEQVKKLFNPNKVSEYLAGLNTDITSSFFLMDENNEDTVVITLKQARELHSRLSNNWKLGNSLDHYLYPQIDRLLKKMHEVTAELINIQTILDENKGN